MEGSGVSRDQWYGEAQELSLQGHGTLKSKQESRTVFQVQTEVTGGFLTVARSL